MIQPKDGLEGRGCSFIYEGTHWAISVVVLLGTGVVSGFASGLFGIGGGTIRVPIFLYMFPALGASPAIAMHLSAGTSLALGIPSTLAATWRQYCAGTLDGALLTTWVPALPAGVLLGLGLASVLPGHVLASVFGVMNLLLSAKMLLFRDDASLTSALPGLWVRTPIAFAIGAASTMAGISGGSVVTPILTMLRVPIHRAVAAASAGSAAVTTIGAIGMVIAGWHVSALPLYAFGYVDLPAFILIMPIVTLAAPFGVRVANRLSNRVLKNVMGAVLLAVGAYMIVREWLGLP